MKLYPAAKYPSEAISADCSKNNFSLNQKLGELFMIICRNEPDTFERIVDTVDIAAKALPCQPAHRWSAG